MVNKKLEELKAIAEQAQKAYEDELKLAKKKEAEEAARKQAELAAEREKREEEIADVMNNLEKLLVAYNKDYGAYRTNRSGIFGSLWPFFI